MQKVESATVAALNRVTAARYFTLARRAAGELESRPWVTHPSYQLGAFMNQPLQANYTAFGEVASVEQRNRVLRNTYWLLALSMVPTVLGAWIGVSTGIIDAAATSLR